MSITAFRVATFVMAAVLVPVAALATAKPFAGPAGWDHTVGATATAQLPRAQETWKKSDGELLTYLSDGGQSFDDVIGLVKKNVADNGIKVSVAKERTCSGRRAYEIEAAFGPSMVHQIIVDDAPGITKVTYVRPQSTPSSAEAGSALETFCAT